MAHLTIKHQTWAPAQHEAAVERFYATGPDGYHDFHGGYLNFGLWERPGMRYEEAAEMLVRRMGETLGLDARSRLLDIGCGMGAQDVLLHRTFAPATIDGLDVTRVHVARSRERAQRSGIGTDRLRFHHGSGTAIPFPDGSFTHILAIESPEHMDTRETFFREAARVLVPGGVLAVCDYALTRAPKNATERALIAFAARTWHVPDANIYDITEYEERLRAAGFTDVTIAREGARVIPGYYHEHRRWPVVRDTIRIRGFWKGVVGGTLIDRGVYDAYRRGLMEYLIVRAVRT